MNMKEKENPQHDFEVIGTKISAETMQRMEAIANKMRITKYQLIQMACDVLVRFMDDRHNLSPEMSKLIGIFESPASWPDGFNLCDPTVQKEVGEALYILDDPSGKKHGVRAVHVDKPYFGDRTMTINVRDIIERLFCQLTPTLYMRLRYLATEKECHSLLELLVNLVDIHSNDSDIAEIRQMFEDCNRVYNRNYEYGQRTKQTKTQSIEKQGDLFDSQPTSSDEQG